jgi:hypothetical protein
VPQGSEQADAAVARLRDILEAAQREVERLLRRIDTMPGRSTMSRDAQSLTNNQEVVRQVQQSIATMRTRALAEARAAALTTATSEAQRIGVTFTPRTAALVQAIVEDRIKEIDAVFGDAALEVGRAARIVLATTADASTFVDRVSAALGSSRAQALSAVDSVAMASGRQVTIIDAEMAGVRADVDIVYGYGGPIDSITRPFCREHATVESNSVYTFAALNRLDNGAGQPMPVSVYLGGYRCRHFLVPMTQAEAVRRGHVVVD